MYIPDIQILTKIIRELSEGKLLTTLEIYGKFDIRSSRVRRILDEINEVFVIEEKGGIRGTKTYRLASKLDKIDHEKRSFLYYQIKTILKSYRLLLQRLETWESLKNEYALYDKYPWIIPDSITKQMSELLHRIFAESNSMYNLIESTHEETLLHRSTEQMLGIATKLEQEIVHLMPKR